MRIPSLKRGRQAMALKDSVTVCCINCKTPLWRLSDLHQYGTKTGAVKESIGGTPVWSDYWEKDGRTPKRMDCPFCHEHYLKAIQVGELTFPKFWIAEIDGTT